MSEGPQDKGADKGQEQWERNRDEVMRLAATDEGIEILQRRALRALLRLKDDELQEARRRIAALEAALVGIVDYDPYPDGWVCRFCQAVRPYHNVGCVWEQAKQALTDAPQQG